MKDRAASGGTGVAGIFGSGKWRSKLQSGTGSNS